VYTYFRHSYRIHHELLRLPQPIVRGKLRLLFHSLRSFTTWKYWYSERICFNSSDCYGDRHSLSQTQLQYTIEYETRRIQSSVVWRRIDWYKPTDVSEGDALSVFRAEWFSTMKMAAAVSKCSQISTRRRSVKRHFPHWGSTQIRRRGTKFSHPGDLVSGICAPLVFRS